MINKFRKASLWLKIIILIFLSEALCVFFYYFILSMPYKPNSILHIPILIINFILFIAVGLPTLISDFIYNNYWYYFCDLSSRNTFGCGMNAQFKISLVVYPVVVLLLYLIVVLIMRVRKNSKQ